MSFEEEHGLGRDKSFVKSKRRHALKEIDRKWKPKLEAGKSMAKALAETLKKAK